MLSLPLGRRTLSRFHIPVLCKHVASEEGVSTDNNGPQSERKGTPSWSSGWGGGVLIDAGKSVFSLEKHGAFVGPLQPQKGRRLGSADVLRKAQRQLLCSANEQGDDPDPLCSHLSTRLHITEGVRVSDWHI